MSFLKNAALSIVCVIVLLTFLEGASSILLFARGAVRRAPATTVKFDSEIGWVGIPDLHVESFYGNGTYFKTNSLGLVADREYGEAIPAGSRRVLCSGNSFPAGEGVGNGKNWCHRLESKGAIEAINLAQAGYSLDQAFLTYQRYHQRFKHSAHVVSFTGIDFEFLLQDNYLGKKKPVLSWKDGHLVQTNSPLRQISADEGSRYLLASSLNELRISYILAKFFKKPSSGASAEPVDVLKSLPLAIQIFKEEKALALKDQAQIFFVYQPTYQDLYMGKYKELRSQLKRVSKNEKLPYYDLTDDLSDFSVREMVEGGNGHYQPQVHDRIAELLARKIQNAPNTH